MNRPTRRSGLISALAILIALPTAAANAGLLEDRLASTRADAKEAKVELSAVDRRQQAVVRDVSRLNGRLAELEVPLRRLEAEVAGLDDQIAKREQRIIDLRAARERQRKEIQRLNLELTAARSLLATRVVTAYKSGDTGIIEQLAAAANLEELFRRQETLGQIVGLDERVIGRITGAEREVRIKRARNFELRRRIREDILRLSDDRSDVDLKRARAQAARDEVAALRTERDVKLVQLGKREEDLTDRLENLEDDAAKLQKIIDEGGSNYGGTVGGLSSSSGFIWPVNGTVSSPFGPRWGRLHEGIDIAMPNGSPIGASAAGVVSYAGWMGGYGYVVLIQHANDMVTAYAHQARVAVSVGQTVTQGQVIGYIGCTGNCFGYHTHFEIRASGTPQDPLGYLS